MCDGLLAPSVALNALKGCPRAEGLDLSSKFLSIFDIGDIFND